MKKFSNQEYKHQSNKNKRHIEKIVTEKINISYSGDPNEIVNKKLTIDGIDKLCEQLNSFICQEKDIHLQLFNETLKYNFGNSINQKELNNLKQILEDTLYPDIIPSPEDIFSSEDYENTNDSIILHSLNNIPDDFADYINYEEVNTYFENKNKITIKHANTSDGWTIKFVPDISKYGINIDSTTQKYIGFIKVNKDFVADFLTATIALIGNQNLKIDNTLINIIK